MRSFDLFRTAHTKRFSLTFKINDIFYEYGVDNTEKGVSLVRIREASAKGTESVQRLIVPFGFIADKGRFAVDCYDVL